jgi:hypothetical protein
MSGSDGGEVTPVPIPNTEVKLSSADGSWEFPARVGRRQAMRKGKIWKRHILPFFVAKV